MHCENYTVILGLLYSSPVATQCTPRSQYIAFCSLTQAALSFCAMCEATSHVLHGTVALSQQSVEARQHALEVILHMPEVFP